MGGLSTDARIAVLHTSVHTTHYPDQSTEVWDRSAPGWVGCEHFDESTFGPLIEGLGAGRFHALALASASLQSSANRQAVASGRFADALTAAFGHGLGLIVLQGYLGAGQRLRFPGLATAIDGELVDRRRVLSCADLDLTQVTGLDTAAVARTREVLRRAESRATGLSPTGERSAGARDAGTVDAGSVDGGAEEGDGEAHRATTVFSGWRPRMPGSWRTLLSYPDPDGDLIALGHSQSVGNRVFVSSLPLDRWGAEDLLREVMSRAVRPRGLLVVETPEHGLAQDGVLGGLYDAHLASGGFAHRSNGDGRGAHLADRFGHLLLVGAPLDISAAVAVRAHVSRLEHGGSIVGRLDGEGGPVVRLAGIPEHLQVARDVERHLVRRLSDPRSLLTFEFLALARLARALERSVSDVALVPPGLRRESLATRLGRALRERVDARSTVDGFVLPTAAAAAALHLLARPGVHEPTAAAEPGLMIAWALGSGAPEVDVDHQFTYLAELAGESVGPEVDPAAVEPFWSRLLRLRRDDTVDLELLAGLVEATTAPALLAYVVLDALDGLDGVPADSPHRREVLSRLRPAGSTLRRGLARALSGDDGTVETVALAAAATIRLLAAGDPVIGWAPDAGLPVWTGRGSAGERTRDGAGDAHHLLLEQQRIMSDALDRLEQRRHREVSGLQEQRARMLPLVRIGLVALAASGVGVAVGLLWVGWAVIGLTRDGLASTAVALLLVASAAVWRRRRIGQLSPLTLLRGRRSIEDELDRDAFVRPTVGATDEAVSDARPERR